MIKKALILFCILLLLLFLFNFARYILGYGQSYPPAYTGPPCIPINIQNRPKEQLTQEDLNCYVQKTQRECEAAQNNNKCTWMNIL